MDVSGQVHTHEKSPWYSSDRRLNGPHSQSEHCGGEKNLAPVWTYCKGWTKKLRMISVAVSFI
jgi:hypothetical protein